MQTKIQKFKEAVAVDAAKPTFVHHKWFVRWHLEIVERIATELCDSYSEADRDLVVIMVWLHDYGKILNFDDQYAETSRAGRKRLSELGFVPDIIDKAVKYIEILDKKLEIDLHNAPIEVQIVSSADGCSHMVGPFLSIFWNEATDKTFPGKEFEELMALNWAKIEKDWNYKIVLPEARKAFELRHAFLREQAGELPKNFIAK